MSDIPSEIYREMLVRLQAESLFRFRAVCKAWRRLIDDPSFVKSHSNNHRSDNTLLLSVTDSFYVPHFYHLSLDSLNFNDDYPQTIKATPIKEFRRSDTARMGDLPVSSCNGLILISNTDESLDEETAGTWVIWNPLAGKGFRLYGFDSEADMLLEGKGLGYDYATDDYKVVRIACFEDKSSMYYDTVVYSMRAGTWRDAKNCPVQICGSKDGLFLNGALHWRSEDFIIAFDVGTEDYRLLPLPPAMSSGERHEVNLDVLGGCLALSYAYFALKQFDVWVMNDYGVEKSWMKLFSLEARDDKLVMISS